MIPRRAVPPALRALLLVLASALLAAPAQASRPSLNDLARAGDELQARPSALSADLPRELPKECNGPFYFEPLKTRVGGFDLRLSCSVGGEGGVTCGSRPAYGFGYGGCAVERSVFTSHRFDTELNLYYAGGRMYSPTIGRFISQDPLSLDPNNPDSWNLFRYAFANPTRFVDPTGHAAGDLWDPRTYFGSKEARAGAWAGFKEGYFQNAADVGDSLGAFGVGVGKAGWGLAKGTVGLAVGAAKLQNELVIGTAEYAITGNPNRLHEFASEVKSGAGSAWQEVKTTARLAKAGYSDPTLALDAATELGIKGTSEVLGGATFETGMLVAPMAKGAPVAGVVQESRRGINLVASKVSATTETAAGKAAAARAAERAAARAAAAEAEAARVPAAVETVVDDVASHAGGKAGGGSLKSGVPGDDFVPNPTAGDYVRPRRAGPRAVQSRSVQGKPCVDCGAITPRQVADHIEPLSVEHFRTGRINVEAQRSVEAVQPHCPTCSAQQGGQLSGFVRRMREVRGIKGE